MSVVARMTAAQQRQGLGRLSSQTAIEVPRVGMFATVRNRRGIIAGVDPFDGPTGRQHLVHVEYKDDGYPLEEQLLWELEPGSHLLPPAALPDPAAGPPMPADDFDALVRAARWSAAMPFLEPDDSGPLERLPIRSPFHGAVQVEDYQLVPLLKALSMPRVNLLLADDVGLGKTVEAGLILSELLLRRRIQRVLILTPASLRLQWRDEMWDKFSIRFDLVDRDESFALRRRLGMDANPWRSFSRIIASYHYLRQEDILEQFIAACRTPEGSPHAPWDLLILDECHNLMPSPFGEDSDLCRMLRIIAPRFEHKLFLSATPHNGHTRSFTGLLEMLDPVRFSQTDELRPAERERVKQVVMRRLKREINARTDPPKFCTRLEPRALVLDPSPQEQALSRAFDEFRTAMRGFIAGGERRKRRAGSFAVEILGKRLLSCPVAFAESWRRCRQGLDETAAATEDDVETARRTVERETSDDREAQSRESVAAEVVGAWLRGAAGAVQSQIAALDAAVAALGLDLALDDVAGQDPVADARFAELVAQIDELLRAGDTWRDDERLVVFTEYKTTLDYLVRRLREHYCRPVSGSGSAARASQDAAAAHGSRGSAARASQDAAAAGRILTLYGGMDEDERDAVKQAFNDPAEPVRVLVATDAASEGLNLQRTARYLLHFDCPWNPSKLEQRNGRLDRHGQARDVQVFHFITEEDQDLRFLAHVIHKADEIREDLGSVNELFDEAAHRRLVDGESAATVQADLDARIARARGRAAVDADDTVAAGGADLAAAQQLDALAAELDLGEDSLRDTLEAALAMHAGRPQLDAVNSRTGEYRLLSPGLPGWAEIVDESLRRTSGRDGRGALSRLAFGPRPFLQQVGRRVVFNPRPDVAMLHLSHPMFERALAALTRKRFPGGGEEVSRWTVRAGDVPDGARALILLTVEELAVNELRETFHHWVRTIELPVNGSLGAPLAHRAATGLRSAGGRTGGALAGRAEVAALDVLEEVEPDLKRLVGELSAELTVSLLRELAAAGEQARQQEDKRYRERHGEVSKLIEENTLAKLERQIDKLKVERQQGTLFDEAARLDDLDRSIEEKQAELERRRRHYEEVRDQLDRERERILRYLLPKRYTMSGDAQVFPVTIEVRLPAPAPSGGLS